MRCIIEECGNPISPRSRHPICELCRNTMYRWRRRRPSEVLERVKRLTMYQSRMESISDLPTKKRK